MFEHLGNCHGEMTMLLMFLGSLPFVGWRFKAWMQRRKKPDCPCGHEGGEQH